MNGDTTNAHDDYHFASSSSCPGTDTYTQNGPDLVYGFIPSATGAYTFTAVPSSGFDVGLYVLDGSFCPSSPMSSCLGGDDWGGTGTTEEVTANLVAGHTYLVVVDSYTSSATGTFSLVVNPAQNTCATPNCTVFAHTDTAIYQVDAKTLTATQHCTVSGLNHSGSTEPLYDLAVGLDGLIYVTTPTELYTVDPSQTGTCQASWMLEFPTSSNSFNGLTFTLDGRLIGARSSGEVSEIDPWGGTVTVVGSYGGNFGNSGDLVALPDGRIMASAVDSTGSITDDILVTLDPNNGYAASEVGQITGYNSLWGMGYWGGNVYGFDSSGNIIEIDPADGQPITSTNTSGVAWFGAGTSPSQNVP